MKRLQCQRFIASAPCSGLAIVNSQRTASRFGKIAPNIAASLLSKNDESCSRAYRNSVVVFPTEKDHQIHTHSHLLNEKREALLGPSAPFPVPYIRLFICPWLRGPQRQALVVCRPSCGQPPLVCGVPCDDPDGHASWHAFASRASGGCSASRTLLCHR